MRISKRKISIFSKDLVPDQHDEAATSAAQGTGGGAQLDPGQSRMHIVMLIAMLVVKK